MSEVALGATIALLATAFLLIVIRAGVATYKASSAERRRGAVIIWCLLLPVAALGAALAVFSDLTRENLLKAVLVLMLVALISSVIVGVVVALMRHHHSRRG